MSIGGKPVVNATKKITIHITPRDVRDGGSKDPGGCAAARAIKRELGCKQARVHIGRTYVLGNDDRWVKYRTPEALRSEIIAFDRGGSFEPGEYVLQAIPPSDRKPRVKSNKRLTRRKRAVQHVVANVRERGANR